MAPKKILMILTSNGKLGDTGKPSGWYLPEAAHPYHEFSKAGYDVAFASPKGGVAPIDPASVDLSDETNKAFWEDPTKKALTETTKKISDCSGDDYDAIFLVGGFGVMWDLPTDPDLQKLITSMYEGGKVVAAVCHGPAGLLNVKLSNGEFLIKGNEISVFTNEEEDAMKLGVPPLPFFCEDRVGENGGKHVTKPAFEVCVSVSGDGGRLITGQNPKSATATGEAVVTALSK